MTSDPDLSLGAFLSQRRRRLGLSIREAAKRIGVDHAHLVRWEQDKIPPRSAVRLHAIATVYQLQGESFAELLEGLVTLSIQEALDVPVLTDLRP